MKKRELLGRGGTVDKMEIAVILNWQACRRPRPLGGYRGEQYTQQIIACLLFFTVKKSRLLGGIFHVGPDRDFVSISGRALLCWVLSFTHRAIKLAVLKKGKLISFVFKDLKSDIKIEGWEYDISSHCARKGVLCLNRRGTDELPG